VIELSSALGLTATFPFAMIGEAGPGGHGSEVGAYQTNVGLWVPLSSLQCLG